jgi:hypothetical protein
MYLIQFYNDCQCSRNIVYINLTRRRMPHISCLVQKAYDRAISIIFISINYCLPKTKETLELSSFYVGPQSEKSVREKLWHLQKNNSLVSYT